MIRRAFQRFAAVAAAATLLSCGGRTDESEPDPEPDNTATATSTVDSDTLVVLERADCYGGCPVYSLSISGDGTVAYFGQKFVHVKGAASRQVSTSGVQALVDQMLRADYFNLSVPSVCPEGLFTDAASATTSLTLHGQTHTVEDYHGNPCAPVGLRALEDAIDILADSAEWIACDDSTGACCEPAENPYQYPCSKAPGLP